MSNPDNVKHIRVTPEEMEKDWLYPSRLTQEPILQAHPRFSHPVRAAVIVLAVWCAAYVVFN